MTVISTLFRIRINILAKQVQHPSDPAAKAHNIGLSGRLWRLDLITHTGDHRLLN